MATFNLTPSQTAVPSSGMSLLNGRVPCVVETVVDFGLPTLPSGVTAISGTSGTVIDLTNVPAGFAVYATQMEVLRADTAGNSGTIQIKVGAASQGSAVTVASNGFVASGGTLTPVVPAAANAFVTATIGTGTINAVVRFVTLLIDLRARPGSAVFIGTWTNPSGQTTAFGWDPISNYTAVPLVYVT